MERSLLLLSFALGGMVWLCGFLSSGVGRGAAPGLPNRLSKFWIAAAVALPIVVFLATSPSRPPFFAAGHGLGTGFLVGGLLGLLAVFTILRAFGSADQGEPVSAAAAIAAPAGLALLASTASLIWLRGSLLDALCGTAIGWLCAVFLAVMGSRMHRRIGETSAAFVSLAFSAGACALFCSMAGLGELRGLIDLIGKNSAVVHWSTPGLVFSSCLCVLLLLALLPASLALRVPLLPLITGWIERGRESDAARGTARRTWRMGICYIVVLLVGRMAAVRYAEQGDEPWKTKSALLKPLSAFLGPNPMFHVIALGVVAAILICWLVRDQYRDTQSTPAPGSAGHINILAILTLAGAGMIAFQLMGGFGLSLMLSVILLAAALTAAAALSSIHEQALIGPSEESDIPVRQLSTAAHVLRVLLLGTILVLYRLFSVRFESEIRGVGLTDHYALFGILFGAALPSFLLAYLTRSSGGPPEDDGGRLLRLATTGILVLILPTLIIALWGAKCALAFLIGLALSTVFEGSILSALLALAVALALTQWAHHVLPLAQLTRDQKITNLLWTTIVTVLAVLASEIRGRWRAAGGGGASASSPEGAAQ